VSTNAGNDGEANRITGSGPGQQAGPDATEYWTAERRAAAIPIPLPMEAVVEGTASELPPQAGEPGASEPQAPSDPADRNAEENPRFALDPGGNPVTSPLAYPYSACGILFFTQGGNDYGGSASLIAPNVLLTAGHCVYGAGAWSTNVSFYPSYPSRASTDPSYMYSYSYVAAWSAWSANSNRAYDYGLVWIDNSPGSALGWLGLLWNADTNGRTWDAVGYPATPSPPFDGNTMDEAVGTVESSATAGTIGLNNDNMEHGSSGGPWITDWNGSARIYANGVQSFHINDGDFTEYGPYFTPDVKSLVDWISNPANRV
jgi:V8-like Glu-specific endopeptidase